jgi:hypothetical protein
MRYQGSCHCGAIRFSFESEAITTGVRCNCSICQRRGAVMSSSYVAPEAFELAVAAPELLAVYQFGDHDMNHYFCARCGIFPFSDVVARPGHRRVNLGCVDGIDPLALEIRLIDGRSF